jgi:hypothetical protein
MSSVAVPDPLGTMSEPLVRLKSITGQTFELRLSQPLEELTLDDVTNHQEIVNHVDETSTIIFMPCLVRAQVSRDGKLRVGSFIRPRWLEPGDDEDRWLADVLREHAGDYDNVVCGPFANDGYVLTHNFRSGSRNTPPPVVVDEVPEGGHKLLSGAHAPAQLLEAGSRVNLGQLGPVLRRVLVSKDHSAVVIVVRALFWPPEQAAEGFGEFEDPPEYVDVARRFLVSPLDPVGQDNAANYVGKYSFSSDPSCPFPAGAVVGPVEFSWWFEQERTGDALSEEAVAGDGWMEQALDPGLVAKMRYALHPSIRTKSARKVA